MQVRQPLEPRVASGGDSHLGRHRTCPVEDSEAVGARFGYGATTMRSLVCVVVAVCASACRFEVDVPSGTIVSCSADDPACPAGMVCRARLRRCVAAVASDSAAPRLLSSQLSTSTLRAGQELRVELVASEPLLESPRVGLVTGGLTVPLALISETLAEGRSVFAYTATGEEPEGPARLAADLIDASGTEALAQSVGVVTLDFTAPRVARAEFVAPRTSDGGVLRLRSAEPAVVRVLLSEPVLVGSELRGSAPGCADLTFRRPETGGDVLDFTAAAPVGVAGCTYALRMSGVRDVAGNGLSSTETGLTLTLDDEAPRIEGLELGRLVDGGWQRASVFSRTHAFDEVRLHFTVDPTTVALAATFDGAPWPGCGTSCAQAVDGGRSCACTRQVQLGDGEGAHSVAIVATDEVGNVATASAALQLDFTAPRVIDSTVQLLLRPPAASLVPAVRALSSGGVAQVLFSVTEPAMASLASPEPDVSFALSSSTPTSFVFAGALVGASAAEGPRTLLVTLVDAVGNESSAALAQLLRVDDVAPAAPRVLVDAGVIYVRTPWGAADAGPHFTVVGAPGSVEPDALVVAFDSRGFEAGRGVASDAGAFNVELSAADRPAVWLSAVDGAGNASARVDVKEVTWTASLGGKVLGRLTENPHSAQVRPRFTQALDAPGATEVLFPATAATAPRWFGGAPTSRIWHGLAFDARRRKTVLYGGQGAIGAGAELWEWDGERWASFTTVAGGPPARSRHAMAFDSIRGTTLVFGGDAAGLSNALWEWDGVAWTDRTSSVGPSPRADMRMVFDTARARLVVYGGVTVPANSTHWEWDGAAWSNRTPASGGPGDRTQHAMAFDESRGVTVLFGGGPGTLATNEVWEWDGASWTNRTPSAGGPSARRGAALVYDGTRRSCLLFGGFTASATATNELWEWNGASWTNLTPSSGGPAARADHALAYDAARRVVVLSGGQPTALAGSVWEFGATGWVDRSPRTPPPAFRGASLTFDAARGRAVLVAGQTTAGLTNEVWEWDGQRWVDAGVPAGAPSPRTRHAAAFDSQLGEVLVFGGNTDFSATASNQLWGWNGTGWTNRTAAGPSARADGAMAYDAARGRLVLFGGAAGSTSNRETWEWADAGWANRTPSSGGPSARIRHAMAYDAARARVVLVGGFTNTGASAETWEWDGATWVDRTPASGGPPGVYGHSLFADSARRTVVLQGGQTAGARNAQTWEWDGVAWANRTYVGGPGGLSEHGATYDSIRQEGLLVGGVGGPSVVADAWRWRQDNGERPAVVLRFPFSYAEAPVGSALFTVQVHVHAGASSTAEDGGSRLSGAALWSRSAGGGFAVRRQNVAPSATPASLDWLATAPGEPAALLAGPTQELSVVIAPVSGADAEVSVVDAWVQVSYRRP